MTWISCWRLTSILQLSTISNLKVHIFIKTAISVLHFCKRQNIAFDTAYYQLRQVVVQTAMRSPKVEHSPGKQLKLFSNQKSTWGVNLTHKWLFEKLDRTVHCFMQHLKTFSWMWYKLTSGKKESVTQLILTKWCINILWKSIGGEFEVCLIRVMKRF